MYEYSSMDKLFEIANNMQFLYEMKYALKKMEEALEELKNC